MYQAESPGHRGSLLNLIGLWKDFSSPLRSD